MIGRSKRRAGSFSQRGGSEFQNEASGGRTWWGCELGWERNFHKHQHNKPRARVHSTFVCNGSIVQCTKVINDVRFTLYYTLTLKG